LQRARVMERMSIRDISSIIKEEMARRQDREDDSQKQLEGRLSANAYSLFEKGKTPVEVAIELELEEPPVSKFHKEYLKLKGLSEVASLYEKIGDDAQSYLELYKLAKSSGMSNEQIVRAVDVCLNKIPSADEDYYQTRKKVNELTQEEQYLSGVVDNLRDRILSLSAEIEDLNAEKAVQAKYHKLKMEELEEIRREKQLIQRSMNRYQQMIIMWNVIASDYAMKMVEKKIVEMAEIREMYKGDIAE
jgi:uncharacterized small protein (DUF1192 family)